MYGVNCGAECGGWWVYGKRWWEWAGCHGGGIGGPPQRTCAKTSSPEPRCWACPVFSIDGFDSDFQRYSFVTFICAFMFVSSSFLFFTFLFIFNGYVWRLFSFLMFFVCTSHGKNRFRTLVHDLDARSVPYFEPCFWRLVFSGFTSRENGKRNRAKPCVSTQQPRLGNQSWVVSDSLCPYGRIHRISFMKSTRQGNGSSSWTVREKKGGPE